MPCLLIVITLRFTCGEKNIRYSIKKFQDIMLIIAVLKFKKMKDCFFHFFSFFPV